MMITNVRSSYTRITPTVTKHVIIWKTEFEKKDLDKTKQRLRLQLEPFTQLLWYTKLPMSEILDKLNMDKLCPSPMPVVRSLDIEKDSLNHGKMYKRLLEPRVPYHNAIGPTNKMVGIKNIFRYLQDTISWPIVSVLEKSELQYHYTFILATYLIP